MLEWRAPPPKSMPISPVYSGTCRCCLANASHVCGLSKYLFFNLQLTVKFAAESISIQHNVTTPRQRLFQHFWNSSLEIKMRIPKINLNIYSLCITSTIFWTLWASWVEMCRVKIPKWISTFIPWQGLDWSNRTKLSDTILLGVSSQLRQNKECYWFDGTFIQQLLIIQFWLEFLYISI